MWRGYLKSYGTMTSNMTEPSGNDTPQHEKIAVILLNLGGPDSLKAVRPFLFNLFYDPAILSLKNPLRWIAAMIISHRRSTHARAVYEKIGNHSPIVINTEQQAQALELALNDDRPGPEYKCFISMRYWRPFSRETVKKVKEYNPDRIILLPLYPHYSITTVGSSLIDWDKNARASGLDIPYHVVRDYPENKDFIAAHVNMITKSLENLDPDEEYRILYSAHGLPEKIIEAGDPFRRQTEKTCQAIQEKLGHPDHIVCFQSRVGPMKWIEPYTEDEIIRAGAEGKSVIIVPVSFVSEHSETLVELDIEYGKIARSAGVKKYIRVAALGCHESYICALEKLAKNAHRQKKKP